MYASCRHRIGTRGPKTGVAMDGGARGLTIVRIVPVRARRGIDYLEVTAR